MKSYSKDLEDLKNIMTSKLTELLEGGKPEGVSHKFGDEIIAKGAKCVLLISE